jgi:hypothetical protein|nr:MAG TPA: hypothetical protein [Crassvirales sp.]
MIRQLRSRISLTIKVSVDNVIKDYDINSVTFNEVIDAIRVGRALMDMSMPFERDMNKINVKGGVVTCNSSDNGNQLVLTIYNEKNYR